MKNKRALIALGIILLLTIILLTIYALNFKVPFLSDPSQVKPLTELSQSKLSQFSNSQKASEEEKLELEKIKKGIANIKNESLVIKELTSETEGCDNEEAQAYEEEIKAGTAKVIQGIVQEKNSSTITMNFNQNSFSWTSTVIINQNTSIETIDKDSKKQPSSLSDIQIGDNLVVKSEENITNERFTAVSIFKLN